MRPSDDTRDQALTRLRRGYATGRLDTDTFSRRVDRALGSTCGEEIKGLTVDLPAPPPGRLARWLPARRRAAALPPLDSLAAARLLMGRSSACHLVFADDTVSRRHAELYVRDGHWMLRDLGSSNGTWINGRLVVEAEVAPGDEIHLGHAAFRL